MRLSKILCFVSSEQINIICGSQKLRQIIDLRLFYHSVTEFVFLINFFGKLPFSHKSDHKKEKSVVSFIHEQNIISSWTQLDNIAHEQNIICG